MSDRLRVEVLGPLRVLDQGGRDVTPGGTLQRRLLALLVLRRDRVVTMDTAIDALWPDAPPADPVGSLHNQVFRLRRSLPDGLIESTGDGYRLPSTRIELDADLPDAAERWRAPAYPELADLDDGRAEAMRLDELRVRGIEDRATRALTAGDGAGLVAELTALAEDQPLRERPRALLMEALARAGRHAEALRVYDDFRRTLGAELGIEPSPSLTSQRDDLLAGTGRSDRPASRLPTPATSLLGRRVLADEVTTLLSSARVVTLVGPGGVGKTRLAIEVGRVVDRPVVLCELASTDERSAVGAVAAALGIDARTGVEPIERITSVLGDSPMVLLLDNCEHVLEPVAALVERLVAACPAVTVLATSRERLRVAGEVVRGVPTLSWDDEHAPALELFVERAHAVAPDFALDDRVLDVVRRLDGLPLAIELAAALLLTHDIDEISAGLDARFTLLESGYRASSRHGSLHAAVSSSFELLDDRLRRTFSEVSVFVGPFTADDAAAVCGADVSGALAQLAERSLVQRAPGRRYALLETLRSFGAERLTAEGRADDVRERHARHRVDWADRMDRAVREGEADAAEIDAVLPDLRAALGWLLDHEGVEPAGRLVTSLHSYGLLCQRPDVLTWATHVTDADPGDRSGAAGQAWAVRAYAAWLLGDVAVAGACARRALRASELVGGPVPAVVAMTLGNHELFEGRLDAAAQWYRKAAADPAHLLVAAGTEVLARGYAADPAAAALADTLLEHAGDAVTPQAAYAWYCAGEGDLAAGREVQARARLTRALELAERSGAAFVTGVAGASRASIDARRGDPVAAAADYRRLVAHWRRSGVWSTQWTMLRSIAVLLERLGHHRDAAVLEGAVRATSAGHRIFGADEAALAELEARLRAHLGDEAYEDARREGSALDGDAAVEHALAAL